jgi:hypothetical protein
MGSADIIVGVERQNKYGLWEAVPRPGQPLDKVGKICWTWDCCGGPDTGPVLGGISLDDQIEPISEPRGLPKDRQRRGESYGEWGHSWLLLSEILAHDWDQVIVIGGSPRRFGYVPDEKIVTLRDTCDSLMRLVRDIQAALPGEDPARIRIIYGFS